MLFLAVILVTMRYFEAGFAISFNDFELDPNLQDEKEFTPSGGQGAHGLPQQKQGCRLRSGKILGLQKRLTFSNYCAGLVCTREGKLVLVKCSTEAGIKCRNNTNDRFPNCCSRYDPCPGAPPTPKTHQNRKSKPKKKN
uniref:Single domain-containing protein n=1 Tax=Amblyomma americanum TaxID=6943 RepID=A0A0C9SDL8_AMBAM